MSRSDPYKKKRRSASQTLLMYGEGLDEETFLKHLRSLYARDSGVSVTIRNGKGGNAVNIVIDAANTPGAFDKRVVILDNDKSKQEMDQARMEAHRKSVDLIENTPCLEAVLLGILRPEQSFSDKTSAWCKKEFESNYISNKKRADIEEYQKVFSKDLLDKSISKSPTLSILISVMEGSR